MSAARHRRAQLPEPGGAFAGVALVAANLVGLAVMAYGAEGKHVVRTSVSVPDRASADELGEEPEGSLP